MDQERRNPPDGRRRVPGGDVLADGFDALGIDFRVHPRKRAAAARPLGPGEVAALDAPQGQHLTRSTEPGISYLSGATSYDFIPPNWRRLGFVLGQVFGDWSKD